MSESEAATSKVCPFCAETIKAVAIKCRYCGSDLSAFVATNAFRPMEPRRAAAHNLPPMDESLFRLVPISNQHRTLDGPMDVWEVKGKLTNTDSEPSSYVINLIGFLNGDKAIVVGLDDAETEIVSPGKTCYWSVKLLTRDVSPPARFQYHVQRQEQPGDIGAKGMSEAVLSNLPGADRMAASSLLQVLAATFEAGEQEQRRNVPVVPIIAGWRSSTTALPAGQSARGVCPTCLKEKRLTARQQLVASHVFNGEKCPDSGVEPTRITKTAAAVPAKPARSKKPRVPSGKVTKTAQPTGSPPNYSASIREPSVELPWETTTPITTQPGTIALASTLDGTGWTPVAQVKSAALGKQGDVGCRCSRCNQQWLVPFEIVNALADLQSVSGRLVRWGRKTQHVGNVLTPGLGTMLSGRSGRKVESQRDFDAAIKGEFRCSVCGSAEVFLAL